MNAKSYFSLEEINIYEYTEDELFVFEEEYELKEYIKSIPGVNNTHPEQSLYACNATLYTNEFGSEIMKVTGDDPIVSLIPKEIFKIPNISKVHIVKEYGFFVKTKTIDDVIYTDIYLFDIINDFQKSALRIINL
jgi:hypothetical protein